MKGLIFNISRYSVHDGPGIRLTIFMKGCPLNCKWCHNPEGILPVQESVVNTRRVGDAEFCRNEVAGEFYSVSNLLTIIERERVFIDHSKGGVTFSGGEPMMQFGFLNEALKACKKAGYHTAVDTSGYASGENFQSIIPFTDLFLFDIKHLDESKHKEATGVSNKTILENYKLLLDNGADMTLRIPVISGYNDDPVHIGKLVRFIEETRTDSLKMISLLPFHRTGSSKYRRLNLPYRMDGVEPPSREHLEEIRNILGSTGIKVSTSGMHSS